MFSLQIPIHEEAYKEVNINGDENEQVVWREVAPVLEVLVPGQRVAERYDVFVSTELPKIDEIFEVKLEQVQKGAEMCEKNSLQASNIDGSPQNSDVAASKGQAAIGNVMLPATSGKQTDIAAPSPEQQQQTQSLGHVHAQAGEVNKLVSAAHSSDKGIGTSKALSTRNSFAMLANLEAEPRYMSIDSQDSIQAELQYMSLDPKVQLGEYISDEVFEQKFTPAKKITRTRKQNKIFDL